MGKLLVHVVGEWSVELGNFMLSLNCQLISSFLLLNSCRANTALCRLFGQKAASFRTRRRTESGATTVSSSFSTHKTGQGQKDAHLWEVALAFVMLG
jgi:hypothetical protein